MKTKNKSATKKEKRVRRPLLTPEQQARLEAARQFTKDVQAQWDALTPQQKKAEEESWQRIMKRMNDDRKGYRQLFVDT